MTGWNRRTSIVSLTFLFLLLLPLSCASEGKQESPEKNDTAEKETTELREITGRISMKGSMPNTYLTLTTAGGKEYKITGPAEEKLAADYQYKKVTVSGEVVKEAVGPGFPAEFQAAEILSSE